MDKCKKLSELMNNFNPKNDLYNEEKTISIVNIIAELCEQKAHLKISLIIEECNTCHSENGKKMIHECGNCICQHCVYIQLKDRLTYNETTLEKEIQEFNCNKCNKLFTQERIFEVLSKGIFELLNNYQVSLKNTVLCPICCFRVKFDEMITLSCGFKICKNCLESVLHEKIIVKEIKEKDLACPDCGFPISDQIISQVVRVDDWDKLTRFRILEENNQNNLFNFVDCPNCGAIMEVPKQINYITCIEKNCKYKFCKKCQYNHSNKISCEQFRNNSPELIENEKKLRDMIKNPTYNIILCPSCQVMIAKDEGCNHIICRSLKCNGKTEFCFICKTQYINSKKMCNCP